MRYIYRDVPHIKKQYYTETIIGNINFNIIGSLP